MVMQKLAAKEEMTEVECGLAQYILNHVDDVVHMTAREVGQAAYTSASSVLRLCRKVGFNSFSEFKLKLAAEYNDEYMKKNVDANVPFKKEDTTKEIVDNMVRIYTQSVHSARDAINYNELEKIVKVIEKRKNIDIYGQGSSLLSASSFSNKMLRIGYTVQSVADLSSQFYLSLNSDETHCAIIISHSGATREGIHVARLLKKRRIPIIAITSKRDSELAKIADYIMCTETGEKDFLIEKMELFQSQIAVYYLLDCLYTVIYSKHYEQNMILSKENERLIKIYRNS
ncbi:MurR/RpiR family transcriptional regulator [Lachnospiraceae bacterium 54-53]